MRRLIIAVSLLAMTAGAAVAADSHWDGRVRLGGIYLDQTGDQSTMPETYNIYDGFTVSSIYLKGYSDPRTHLMLDLTNINQDSRKGALDFRRTGMLRLQSRYTENRWVFDPASTVDASRKNWWTSLSVTPSKSFWVSADYGLQKRKGDRIGLNPGHEGWLGTAYDSKLQRFRLEAQGHANNGIGGSAAYDYVIQQDALDVNRGRTGYVVSANVHAPCQLWHRLTHVLRGAVGRNEVRRTGLGFDLKTIQYTGLVRAADRLRLRYRFDGSRVDDEATTLRTDNYSHDVDGTFTHRMGALMLGYGWEALDDDRAITTTDKFRAALSLHDPMNRISGRVAYDTRQKDDKENTTLIRDTESDRWDVRVDARPIDPVSLGVRYSDRTRELPELGTKADGMALTGYGAWRQEPGDFVVAITEVGVDYTYADDEYDNLFGTQRIASHVVTGRLGLTVFEDLDLTGSFTYLKATKDLDLDKSIISVSAGYRFPRGLLADVQYNVYNYDDYLITNRFYTANVVWFNVGYAFSAE